MLEGKQLFLRKRRFGSTGRIEKVCSPFCRSRIVDGYAGRWMTEARCSECSGEGHAGGALYLGTWGSTVTSGAVFRRKAGSSGCWPGWIRKIRKARPSVLVMRQKRN